MGGDWQMDENLINKTLEEYDVTKDIDVSELDVSLEDIEAELPIKETVYDVIVEPETEVAIDLSESMGWVSGDNRYHDSLLGIDSPNQHPITAIAGLREELDSIKSLKSVYSDKFNVANFYEWKDAAYDEHGYFVSLVSDTSKIEICNGSNIFGVSVDVAGFVGGQDTKVPRGNNYGLIVTSGLIDVRCESNVDVGDYVVSNAQGWAKKSGSNYGYKVLSVENKRGIEYAVIALGVQADVTNALGLEILDIDDRLDAAETNIVSAINVANQAYNKAGECEASNQEMSGKVDSALGVVDKVASDVENLGSQVSNSAMISAQAKAIAESAATSAESMKNEAVAEANRALAETSELRKEFEEKVVQIDSDLENSALELEATKESIEATIDELQSEINATSSDLQTTKDDLNNTRNELSSDIGDILNSLDNTDGAIVSITKKVEANETSINNLTVWKDATSTTITNIEQKTNENSGSISMLTAWKSGVEDDVESIASIKTQSDANKSSIESLTSWQGTASESLASVKQQSDANKASIDSITSWQGETDESITKVQQQADKNAASIQSLTEWKGTTSESISSIEQRVDSAESNISSLTSWQEDARTSIANVEQKSNANESKINSLTSWQGEASESIANVEQKATDNESAITSLTTWQGEANESITSVKQTANQNSADISLIASWKSDVEDDVSSIASIKTTADENKAAIEQLVKKDTELSTTIAGVKTTADANKASIEQITSWQSKVDPTINSVAGIKQTADGNAAKIEGLTTWQGETNVAMARIEQKADANGAYIQSTVSNMDRYTVGPHSQAYGFTLGQAGSVLEEGMIYVPTEDVTEEYSYVDADEKTQTYERTFTPQYLYKWGKVNEQYRWITVDKNYTETSETNTSSKAVYFTTIEPAVSGNFGYWYTNGDTITGTTGTYEPYTLYKWESYVDESDVTQYHWVAVATLAGNSSNRAVSQIRQDANSIAFEVTSPQGSFAGMRAELTETSSKVNSVASWPKGEGEHYLATIEQVADSEGSHLVLAAVTNDGTKPLSGATIVLSEADDGSYIQLDADKIDFTAGDFTIDADHIEFTGQKLNIKVDATNIDGELTIGQLPDSVAETGDIPTDEEIVTIAQGAITANYIETLELEVGKEIKMGPNATISWVNVTEKGDVASKGDVSIAKSEAIAAAENDATIKADNAKLGAINEVKELGYQTASQVTTITKNEISTAKIRANQIEVTDLNAFDATIGGWSINSDGLYKNTTKLLTNDRLAEQSLVNSAVTSPIRLALGATETICEEFYNVQGYCEFGRIVETTIDIPYQLISYDLYEATDEEDGDETFYNWVITPVENGLKISGDHKEHDYTGALEFVVYYTYIKVDGAFKVLDDGSLYASAASITGKGRIGGWSLNDSVLKSGDLGQDNSFYMDTKPSGNNKGLFGSYQGFDYKWMLGVGSNFGVTNEGAVYAKKGFIGKWEFGKSGKDDCLVGPMTPENAGNFESCVVFTPTSLRAPAANTHEAEWYQIVTAAKGYQGLVDGQQGLTSGVSTLTNKVNAFPEFQCGWVVTDSESKNTTVDVTFPSEFSGVPYVFATALSDGANVSVTVSSSDNAQVTTTGCKLRAYRSNAHFTEIYWFAVYIPGSPNKNPKTNESATDI